MKSVKYVWLNIRASLYQYFSTVCHLVCFGLHEYTFWQLSAVIAVHSSLPSPPFVIQSAWSLCCCAHVEQSWPCFTLRWAELTYWHDLEIMWCDSVVSANSSELQCTQQNLSSTITMPNSFQALRCQQTKFLALPQPADHSGLVAMALHCWTQVYGFETSCVNRILMGDWNARMLMSLDVGVR